MYIITQLKCTATVSLYFIYILSKILDEFYNYNSLLFSNVFIGRFNVQFIKTLTF